MPCLDHGSCPPFRTRGWPNPSRVLLRSLVIIMEWSMIFVSSVLLPRPDPSDINAFWHLFLVCNHPRTPLPVDAIEGRAWMISNGPPLFCVRSGQPWGPVIEAELNSNWPGFAPISIQVCALDWLPRDEVWSLATIAAKEDY